MKIKIENRSDKDRKIAVFGMNAPTNSDYTYIKTNGDYDIFLEIDDKAIANFYPLFVTAPKECKEVRMVLPAMTMYRVRNEDANGNIVDIPSPKKFILDSLSWLIVYINKGAIVFFDFDFGKSIEI